MSSIPSVAGDLAPLSERPACVVQAFAAQPLQTEGELLAVGFAADGSLWSVEEPGLLRQWDLSRSTQVREVLLDDVAPLWRFGAGCRIVASASDEITLWDVATGQMLVVFGEFPWVTASPSPQTAAGSPPVTITVHCASGTSSIAKKCTS